GIQIVTSGVSSPLQASSFSFSTNGSSLATDLSNAKLWSTGSSSLFATTTQIGSTYVNPDGTFTINSGSNLPVSLASGNNYFWLTYDISSTASIGNFVDAEFISVNVGTVETPTVGSPNGNREIEIVYCTPTYSSGGSNANITNVTLENLNDNPPANNSPYFFDRTTAQNDVPMLNAGQSYNINITLGSDGNQYSGVWIDFDVDGTFETTEFFSAGSNAGSNGTSTFSIDVPAGATIGETIMRVRGGDDSAVQNTHACGASASSYGQALDYKVSITSPVDMSYVSSNVTQLNTTIISAGAQNQEILCLKIVCSGSLNPLEVSDIVLRTDGSTSPLIDIENAKIWFTGTSSTFSTSSQFGATFANPPSAGTDMTISGTQVLNPGNNYFWLTYDIPATATDGNFADALVASFVLDASSQTPANNDPSGNRQIMQGCLFTLTLNDQYSDGWEGGTINVEVDGFTVLNNVTLASGTSTSFSFVAETGDEIITTYSAGTNPSENSYIITNPNGAFVMMSGEDGTVPVGKTASADCNAVDAFTSNNNAYQNDDAGFIITRNTTSQSGSVWNNFKIDLTQNFSIEFDIYMGNHEGADGIVFAMQGLCTSAGTNGSELGFGGITNSIGVEFDTYENGGWSDPVADHIAIISGGSVDHAAATNLDGPVDVSNLEDGVWRSVIVEWIYSDVNSQTMRVTFDGTPQLTYTDDIITNYLGGSDETFWGFTGSTGAEYNLQKVRITSYPSNSTELTDITIDLGNSVNVEVAGGANSYSWVPDDGSVSDPTAPNPVLSPTVTTEYTCNIEDGCGNIITNKFTVFVNATLPVELGDLYLICDGDQTILNWNTLSEKNNKCFVVEKSYDAKKFYCIDTVAGKGNSNAEVRYVISYQTENQPVYYRLRQIDFNGESSLSEIIYSNCVAEHSEEIKIEVFPNPVSDVLNIKADQPVFGNVAVEIFDLSGKIVFSQRINGGNEPFNARISMEALIPSSYLVRITTDTEVLNFRIVKHEVF
ncbi:MAG: BNR-repeat neuraminidase N-terminal domain-containing protein, partial [Bacteroidales bacterium]|nr:BNR-repeat neuraminidase N-terminal domain-containing protein [Bacteroidales bacterium]